MFIFRSLRPVVDGTCTVPVKTFGCPVGMEAGRGVETKKLENPGELADERVIPVTCTSLPSVLVSVKVQVITWFGVAVVGEGLETGMGAQAKFGTTFMEI